VKPLYISLFLFGISIAGFAQKIDLQIPVYQSFQQKSNWQKLGVCAIAAAPSFFLDRSVNGMMQRNQTEWLEFTERNIVEPFGNKYTISLMGGSILLGYALKNEKLVDLGTIGLASGVVASLLTQIPKQGFHRQRPYTTANDPGLWWGPFNNGKEKLSWESVKNGFFNTENQSFCSGHTSFAFASAAAVAHRFPDQKGVQIAAYGVASLVGLSRVYQGYHWTSDVLYGAMLGLASNWIVEKRWKEAQKSFAKRDYVWYSEIVNQ
jgi:membrane-associated phospholipid phosphatase